MIAEAIEKRYISDKKPVQKLQKNPEIIKKLSTYIYDFEKIFEMNINVISLESDLMKKSSAIRQTEGLLINDSIVLAAMKDLGITNLITNDSDFDRVNWIRVYKPSDI